MRTGKRTWYDDALAIPAGTSGPVEIRHKIIPAGEVIRSGNLRTAMYGQRSTATAYDRATTWHELHEEEHGLWMTDLPIEQRQHDEALVNAYGRVLVGGLGLGYAVCALATKPRVKEIVVVERSQHIVDLVMDATLARVSQLHPKHGLAVKYVVSDLFWYLGQCLTGGEKFDMAFYDIWQMDNEGTFHETVMPLRRMSTGIVKRVVCWNEDIMRGQLLMGLQSRLAWLTLAKVQGVELPHGYPTVEKMATLCGSIYVDWAVPFWQWFAHTLPSDTKAIRAARWYVHHYGMMTDEKLQESLTFMWG